MTRFLQHICFVHICIITVSILPLNLAFWLLFTRFNISWISWFNPSRQLSSTEPLSHPPHTFPVLSAAVSQKRIRKLEISWVGKGRDCFYVESKTQHHSSYKEENKLSPNQTRAWDHNRCQIVGCFFSMVQVCPGSCGLPPCCGKAIHKMLWLSWKMMSWLLILEPGQMYSPMGFWFGFMFHTDINLTCRLHVPWKKTVIPRRGFSLPIYKYTCLRLERVTFRVARFFFDWV